MEVLKDIVSKIFNITKDRISDDLSRENTEEWDSFNHLLLINAVESELQIKFSMAEVEAVKNFKLLREITERVSVHSSQRSGIG